MNWQDPDVQQRIAEWQQLLLVDWRVRESRLVGVAFAWRSCKKKILKRLSWLLRRKKTPVEAEALRVLFWLPGGLGDAACAKRLVTAYRFFLPQARFDIYAPLPGVAKMLFGADKNTRILEKDDFSPFDYDLALQACMAVKFLHAAPERLERLAPRFGAVVRRAEEAQQSLGSLLDDVFLTEGVLGRWLYEQGGRRFELLSYTGGVELPHDAQEPLQTDAAPRRKWGLEGVKYITFHDGSSEAQVMAHVRPTRAWPAVRWCEFFRLFKKEFPQIKLVQLGGRNSPVYEEADVCLVGKTAVAELPSLLAGALAHLDTESGLVHLAQFLPVRSVVLFGPSSAHFLGYAKNENLACGPCGGCMWITPDWMKRCPLGHEPAPCVERISAQAVLAALRRILPH